MKRLLLNILLLTAACTATAQTATTFATIDVAKEGAPISPYLYGQFIEHAGNIIYSALWSEMLDDRKFFYAVMPKPEDSNAGERGPVGFGGGRRRGIGPGRWNPIGPVDSRDDGH